MQAPSDLVYASSAPIMKAQTMAVGHQGRWTKLKMIGIATNAFQSHSPTLASLKSLGAMIDRQQKSRQKSSSMNGTTRTAPNRRTAMNAQRVVGFWKKRSGLNAFSSGLNHSKWC